MKTPCGFCYASGKKICPYCTGSGKQSALFSGATHRCTACSGQRYIRCTNCGGAGWYDLFPPGGQSSVDSPRAPRRKSSSRWNTVMVILAIIVILYLLGHK
jgi:hypothetical protein